MYEFIGGLVVFFGVVYAVVYSVIVYKLNNSSK